MVEAEAILKHKMVPKVEIASDSAIEQLLKKYKMEGKEQLPKILASDIMVKAIGAKRGQVLKITRDSMTAGESVYYRLVV